MEQKNSSDIKKRFGKAIRRRRRELDLSQEELAEKADLHRTYISSILTFHGIFCRIYKLGSNVR